MNRQMLITEKRGSMQMRCIKQARKDGARTKQGIVGVFDRINKFLFY